MSDTRFAVIVVSAENCPACAVLMNDISRNQEAFAEARATMIAAVWCNNIDRSDCDFTIDESVAVAAEEGWPTDRWYVTNDKEGYLRPHFSDAFPTVIVVRLFDMQTVSLDPVPSIVSLLTVLDTQ